MEELEELERRVVELEAVVGQGAAGTIPDAVAEIDAKLSQVVSGDMRKLFDLCEYPALAPCARPGPPRPSAGGKLAHVARPRAGLTGLGVSRCIRPTAQGI
eukprot:COSAG05_NODE_13076_length_442_cov_1.172012_1_plen_100_part_10